MENPGAPGNMVAVAGSPLPHLHAYDHGTMALDELLLQRPGFALYRGRDREGRLRLFKWMAIPSDLDQGSPLPLDRDIRAGRYLTTPAVVPLLEVRTPTSDWVLQVREDAPGRPLCQWLSDPQFARGKRLSAYRATVRALAELHEQGVQHGGDLGESLLYDPASEQAAFIDLRCASYIVPQGQPTFARDLRSLRGLLCAELERNDPTLGPLLAPVYARLAQEHPQAYRTLHEIEPALASPRALASALDDSRKPACAGNAACMRPPSKLMFGREAELAELATLAGIIGQASFELRGQPKTVLLRGEAGVGRSALLEQLVATWHRFGHSAFIIRCAESTQTVAFGALSSALATYLRALTPAQREEAEEYLSRCTAGLTPERPPELAPPQSRAKRISKSRPKATAPDLVPGWSATLEALALKSPGLMICVEDVRWMDRQTAQVLKALLLSPRLPRSSIIISVRNEAFTSGHRIQPFLRYCSQRANASTLTLKPLPVGAFVPWLRTLIAGDVELRGLALSLAHRSGRNPAQAKAILHELSLCECEGMAAPTDTLQLDALWKRLRLWVPDDGASAIFAQRLLALDANSLTVLIHAAALGSNFTHRGLFSYSTLPPIQLIKGLRAGFRAGILWRPLAATAGQQDGRSCFAHTKIRTTLLHLLPELQRNQLVAAALHYRLTMERDASLLPAEELREQLLRAGASPALHEGSREVSLRLLLYMVREARTGGDLRHALHLVNEALQHMQAPPGLPETAQLLLQRAELLSLLGHDQEADSAFERALRAANTERARAQHYLRRTRSLVNSGRFQLAVDTGLKGLAVVGQRVPRSPGPLQLVRALIQLRRGMVSQLHPRWTQTLSPRLELAGALLAEISEPASRLNRRLPVFALARLLTLIEEHGLNSDITLGYGTYAVTLARLGWLELGHRLSRRLVGWSEQQATQLVQGRLRFLHLSAFGHLEMPMRQVLKELQTTLHHSLRAGDHDYMGVRIDTICGLLPLLDHPFEMVLDEVKALGRRLGEDLPHRATEMLSVTQRFLVIATGQAPWSPPEFATTLLDVRHTKHQHARALFYTFEMVLMAQAKRYHDLLALSPHTEVRWQHTGYQAMFHGVLCAIARSAMARGGARSERFRAKRYLRRLWTPLSQHAAHNSDNYGGMRSLVAALRAELRGQLPSAQKHFEAAIHHCTTEGFCLLAALTAEQAAACFGQVGQSVAHDSFTQVARLMWSHLFASNRDSTFEAALATTDRSADGGVVHAEARVVPTPQAKAAPVLPSETLSAAPRHTLARLRDMTKTMQRQEDPEALLQRLLRGCLQEGRATRGFLVLKQPMGTMHGLLARRDSSGAVSLLRLTAAPSALAMPLTVLTQVLASGQRVRTANASDEPNYSSDAYVQGRALHGLWVLPVLSEGSLLGALGLEEPTEPQSENRLTACELLVQQAATHLHRMLTIGRQELKAGIGPHFLFNALSALAEQVRQDPNAAEESILALSKLYRHVLTHSQETTVPLRSELAFSETYLQMEKLRLESRLSYALHVDPAAYDLEVPSFLLQPLVENAIKHGVMRYREGGQLHVRVEVRDGTLRLHVENAGRGERYNHDRHAAPAGTGFGLPNLRQRLQARYGDAAALELELYEDYACASINLPIRDVPSAGASGDASLPQ